MFGYFSGVDLTAVDALRWISIVWSTIAIAWLVQIAVLSRGISTTFLVMGFALSLFIDIGDQYIRLGAQSISYRLPITYAELVMISIGVFYYAKVRSWSPTLFFLFLIRPEKRRSRPDDGKASP